MATSLKRHADVSWYSEESYRTKLARAEVFGELANPGLPGNVPGDVRVPSTIPATTSKTKSNVRIVGTRVVKSASIPAMEREVGALCWIAGQEPGQDQRLFTEPTANHAGPNRIVKLAGTSAVNEFLKENDAAAMRSWRLDGVLVSMDEVDEETLDEVEHSTAAVLVAFQGPTRLKNIYSYRPIIQDVFYMALIYQPQTRDFAWRPCSSQHFVDPMVDTEPILWRPKSSAIPAPAIDQTPLDLLKPSEMQYVIGAYKVGQVLDSSAGSCTVDVDIGWYSVGKLRRMYGPSLQRILHTKGKLVTIRSNLPRNSGFFLGRAREAKTQVRLRKVTSLDGFRTFGPGYVQRRRGFGGRRHPRCGAGLTGGRGGWEDGVPPVGWRVGGSENCGDGPLPPPPPQQLPAPAVQPGVLPPQQLPAPAVQPGVLPPQQLPAPAVQPGVLPPQQLPAPAVQPGVLPPQQLPAPAVQPGVLPPAPGPAPPQQPPLPAPVLSIKFPRLPRIEEYTTEDEPAASASPSIAWLIATPTRRSEFAESTFAELNAVDGVWDRLFSLDDDAETEVNEDIDVGQITPELGKALQNTAALVNRTLQLVDRVIDAEHVDLAPEVDLLGEAAEVVFEMFEGQAALYSGIQDVLRRPGAEAAAASNDATAKLLRAVLLLEWLLFINDQAF
jgi:hypothetical protein